MLFLVSTPIGNLQDFSPRAVSTLQSCDYILCEDTRHSLPLLLHFEIRKKLISFHQHNEQQRTQEVLSDLREGKTIGLISDAGTPGIADPGAKLVEACRSEGLPVSGIPGACAAILALSLSGLETARFQFYGFLPKASNELRNTLSNILTYEHTTICYESPRRLIDVLKLLDEMSPNRKIVICRELTKLHEEIITGHANELFIKLKDLEIRGEIVLLISGNHVTTPDDLCQLSPQEHVAHLQQTYGISQLDAIKLAAKTRGLHKREIYKIIHCSEE